MGRLLDLTAARQQALAAAVARILPSEDGPGAAETGVGEYVAGALEEPRLRHLAPLFERGLDFLQALAERQMGRGFTACAAEEQDEILRTVQQYPNNEARRFFETLVQLAVEGFLCDPRHGGNRGGLGWTYVGYAAAVRPGRCAREAP